jgi:transcriptional regulator
MYLPAHFAPDSTEELHRLIGQYPLGTLVTLGSDGLSANHVPSLLAPGAPTHGSLVGHVGRSNAVWRDFPAEHDALVSEALAMAELVAAAG